MATGKIAKRTVDAMTPPAQRLNDTGETQPATDYLWDEDLAGFGLRVTSNGAKSYVYQYRMGGREAPKKRHTIGKHGSPWTPDSARAEAKRLAMLVGQGTDPVLADKRRRQEAVSLAFGDYAESFIRLYLKTEWPAGWELAAGLLRREAMPAFAGRTIKQIDRGDVAELMDGMADRPAARRNLFAVLRRMFRWAVSRGNLPISPLHDAEPPAAPPSRNRVLDDDELAVVWQASAGLGFPFGPMYRLLISTGQRREEVTGLDWNELDRGAATWTLPAERAKNGQTHIVPLNALAIAELDSLAVRFLDPEAEKPEKTTWPRRGLVFTTTGKTVVSGHSRGKARLDREIAQILTECAVADKEEVHPMPAWRGHDLRRTVATGLQRLGVRFEVTEAVLNHVSGSRSGVAGVYQRHDWKEEKRTALDAWGRHVAAIFEPAAAIASVVPIRAAG